MAQMFSNIQSAILQAGQAQGAGYAALGAGIGSGLSQIGQNRRQDKARADAKAERETERADRRSERAADRKDRADERAADRLQDKEQFDKTMTFRERVQTAHEAEEKAEREAKVGAEQADVAGLSRETAPWTRGMVSDDANGLTPEAAAPMWQQTHARIVAAMQDKRFPKLKSAEQYATIAAETMVRTRLLPNAVQQVQQRKEQAETAKRDSAVSLARHAVEATAAALEMPYLEALKYVKADVMAGADPNTIRSALVTKYGKPPKEPKPTDAQEGASRVAKDEGEHEARMARPEGRRAEEFEAAFDAEEAKIRAAYRSLIADGKATEADIDAELRALAQRLAPTYGIKPKVQPITGF